MLLLLAASAKCALVSTFARFSPAPVALLSCSMLWGTQASAYTPRRNGESRPGSVARALGVQLCQAIGGLLSDQLDNQAHANAPQKRSFFFPSF